MRDKLRWTRATEHDLNQESAREQACPPLMLAALRLAVPLHAARLAQVPWEERKARAEALARILSGPESAALADRDVKARPGQRASLFNALAEALAIGSLQPCGVTWGGVHWEHLASEA